MGILDEQEKRSITPVVGPSGRVTTAIPGFKTDQFNEQFQQELAPPRFKTFTPSDIGQLSQIQAGDPGAVFQQEFGQGFLGAGWFDQMSPQDRELLTIEAANYANKHGVKAFFASMAGGLVSDAPIDLALSLTGIGALSTMNKLAKAGVASKSMLRARGALQKIEDAFMGKGGTVSSRFATRQMTEFATGATAAAISDEIQRDLGRRISADDTLDRMILEGAAGMVFGEALRVVGKSAGFLKDKINKDLPADDKLTRTDHIEEMLDTTRGQPKGDVFEEAEKIMAQFDKEKESRLPEGFDLDAEAERQFGPLDAEVKEKPARAKTIFATDAKGRPGVNPDFKGTIRDVMDELKSRPDDVGSRPSTRIVGELFDNMKAISDRLPGRTQFDELLDVPFQFMTRGDAKSRKPGVVGFFNTPIITDGLKNLRKLVLAGSKGSRLRVKNLGDVNAITDVIAHELVHAATSVEFSARIGEIQETLGEQIGDALKNLSDPKANRELFERAGLDSQDPLVQLNEVFSSAKDQEFDGQYGFTDIEEFIAEALTNESFQRDLQKVKIEGTDLPTSLWDRVVKALGDLLGLRDHDALSETIKSVDALTESFIKKGSIDPNARKRKRSSRKPTRTEAEKKEIGDAAQRIETEVDRINQIAEGPDGWGTGTGVAKGNKHLAWLRENVNSLFTTDNLSAINMFEMMGSAGREMKAKLVEAANLTAKLSNVMQPHLKMAEDMIVANRAELHEKKPIELNIATEFIKGDKDPRGSRETGVQPKAVTISMTGLERIELYMKVMDGLRKGSKDIDDGFDHASAKDIYKKNGGFEVNGKTYVLTKMQVQAIQRSPSLLVDDLHKGIAKDIWDGYRAAVPVANDLSRRVAGVDVMDPDNWFYSPKHLLDTEDRMGLEVFDIIAGTLRGEPPITIAGSLRKRKQTGGRTHELRNPLANLKSYQFSVSNSLGHAEFNVFFDRLLKDNKKPIKDFYGKSWSDTLKKSQAAFTGDTSVIGTIQSQTLAQLLSLRAQAILGYNPGVALKQLGSTWSAVATGKINKTTGVQLSKRSLRFARDKDLRESVVDEMTRRSDLYKQRHESGRINIDLGDLADNLDVTSKVRDIPRNILRKSGIGETLLDAAGKIDEARLKHVGDSMSWIRKLDESAMASIWEASKRQLFAEAGPKTNKEWEEVNTLFSEVIMESQPTYSMGSRTFNQMRRGLAAKALTQFSTQTAKNWGLAYRGILEFSNSKRGPGDQAKLKQDILPLLIQNAYIAAVTTFTAAGSTIIRESLGSDENRRTRMDKEFPNLFARFLVENINGVSGQIAGVGNFTKAMTSSIMGAPIYDQTIPVAAEFISFTKAASDRSVERMLKAAMTLGGVPGSIPRTLGL